MQDFLRTHDEHFADSYVKSYTHPPAAESSAETTEEEHVSLDDIMHEASLIGAAIAEESAESPQYVLPPSAPVELPVRPRVAESPAPVATPSASSAAVHSPEEDEQEDEDDDEHLAINFAMGLPIFNTRATDITKLLGAYDPLDDEYDVDDDERFGEPLEGFYSDFYKLGGLDANGEEVSGTESVEPYSSGDEYYSDEGEFDSDEEDEYDESEYGDEEIDRAYFIGDDEENEEGEEHEHSDADLNAEEGVSVSDDVETEETELEGEEERKASALHN